MKIASVARGQLELHVVVSATSGTQVIEMWSVTDNIHTCGYYVWYCAV